MTKVNWLVARGQVHRLTTSLFLHGSVQHLLFNSLSLSSIGPEAERMFGSERFLATYLAAGTLANYATFVTGSSPVSLGASGCIFGVIGAFTTHFIRNRRILGRRADQGLESIKRTMMLNFLYTGMQPGIDHAAHAYGFVGGAVFSYIFGPRLFFRDNGGRYGKRVVDRPLLNYIPVWKSLKSLLVEGSDGERRDGRFNPRRGSTLT
jgi:membrane associated rhomboid family serine protease